MDAIRRRLNAGARWVVLGTIAQTNPELFAEAAALYGVTYPTVRLRLDRLIQKIRLSEDAASDPYVMLIKRLALNDKLDFDTAKVLITAYRKTLETREGAARPAKPTAKGE